MREKSKPHLNKRPPHEAGFRRAYRLREISAEIGVPVSTLRTMVRRGDLNPITPFGPWLIAAADYERLLSTRLRHE